jgi:predicted membrane metal-binding protein
MIIGRYEPKCFLLLKMYVLLHIVSAMPPYVRNLINNKCPVSVISNFTSEPRIGKNRE